MEALSDELTRKFESGSLDWSDAELEQLPEHWRSQIEADIEGEKAHQLAIA